MENDLPDACPNNILTAVFIWFPAAETAECAKMVLIRTLRDYAWQTVNIFTPHFAQRPRSPSRSILGPLCVGDALFLDQSPILCGRSPQPNAIGRLITGG